MNEKELNENVLPVNERREENEKLKKLTIQRMVEGARVEQKKFDELQKLKKQLKNHLEVIVLLKIIYYIYL